MRDVRLPVTIKFVFSKGPEGEGEFFVAPEEPGDTFYDCRLGLTFRGREYRSHCIDFFECLCEIRKELEKEDLFPFCYGASLNCFPSNMARSMGNGWKIYQLEMGRHAEMEHLVQLFGTGPDITVSTVAEQEAFWEEWGKAIEAMREVEAWN